MEGLAEQEQRQEPRFPMAGAAYQPLPRGKEHGRVLSHAVQTIRSTPEQVFSVYSRPELLPAWQEGVVSVTATGERTQHWVMQDPGTGKHFEYDAELVEVAPGKRLVSRVVNGPFESTTETVLFEEAPVGRGTRVTIISDYKVPGNIVTNALGKLITRSPEQLTIENLRHLKQLMESHEIPSVKDQPAGPRGLIGKWKELLLGENLPTPPGTSDRAQQRDFAEENSSAGFDTTPVLLGTVAAIVGLAAWYGVRRLR